MEPDAPPAALSDFLYQDSNRIASYDAQIFSAHLSSCPAISVYSTHKPVVAMADKMTQKKRVVSKGQYAKYLVDKVTMVSIGTIMFVSGTAGGFLIGILSALYSFWIGDNMNGFQCIGTGFVCGVMALCGRQLLDDAGNREKVVPLTRRTADHLPPEESLVRASQQPAQQLETLLRAAQADETPPEQLLRAGVAATPLATIEN